MLDVACRASLKLKSHHHQFSLCHIDQNSIFIGCMMALPITSLPLPQSTLKYLAAQNIIHVSDMLKTLPWLDSYDQKDLASQIEALNLPQNHKDLLLDVLTTHLNNVGIEVLHIFWSLQLPFRKFIPILYDISIPTQFLLKLSH